MCRAFLPSLGQVCLVWTLCLLLPGKSILTSPPKAWLLLTSLWAGWGGLAWNIHDCHNLPATSLKQKYLPPMVSSQPCLPATMVSAGLLWSTMGPDKNKWFHLTHVPSWEETATRSPEWKFGGSRIWSVFLTALSPRAWRGVGPQSIFVEWAKRNLSFMEPSFCTRYCEVPSRLCFIQSSLHSPGGGLYQPGWFELCCSNNLDPSEITRLKITKGLFLAHVIEVNMGPYFMECFILRPELMEHPNLRHIACHQRVYSLREVKWPLWEKGRFSSLQLNAAAQEVIQVILYPHFIAQSDPNQPTWGQEISSTQMPRRWKLKELVYRPLMATQSYFCYLHFYRWGYPRLREVKWLTCLRSQS